MLEHLEPATMSLSLRRRLSGRRPVEAPPTAAVEVETSDDAQRGCRPHVGESTAPLTDDEVATLIDLIRSDRRGDYDFLCSALGVTNGPEVWDGVRRRARV